MAISDSDRIKAAVAAIQARDPHLAEELRDLRPARAEMLVNEAAVEGGAPQPQFVPETIVLRKGRPVLAVKNDEPELVFREAESEVWKERLKAAKDQIAAAVRAVGRVEVLRHPTFDWIGTAWLVADDIIVTNRHVAAEFGIGDGTRFRFRQGTQGQVMRPSVDFLEEIDRAEAREFAITDILHIESEPGPDMAFLRVSRTGGGTLASRIQLSPHPVIEKQQVAVIGYPARDSRIPEEPLMTGIFGNVYDKKRLAPGQIIRQSAAAIEHDCSTLGGNSGSVVLDLESGAAVGLHFAGRFLVANFAVPANLIAGRLRALGRGESVDRATAAPAGAPRTVDGGSRAVRISIDAGDVHTRIEIDGASSSAAPAVTPVPAPAPTPADGGDGGDDDEVILTEARPEEYENREGYKAGFLGAGKNVPLPEVTRDKDDVVSFTFKGHKTSRLDYEHFSVVMNRRRKMCIFSAVNIDGKRPQKVARPGWRTDPRISQDLQTVKGPYGNEPKFARGHMTRREDPVWGPPETAARGNADSMHLTNAVPQMQPFNAGVWLGLEDYALKHARQDAMKICVFTGPVFKKSDPIKFGSKIPISFWKVIAFIHDETGELSATGYVMSQKDFLQEEEFVFAAHRTAQTTLAAIEDLAGVSFGPLTALDPMADEMVSEMPPALVSFDQIRLVKRPR